MQVRLQVLRIDKTHRGVLAWIMLTLLSLMLLIGSWATIYYVPGFLIWVDSRSYLDAGGVTWRYGHLMLGLLALILLLIVRGIQRMMGQWSFFNREGERGDHRTWSFDLTRQQFWTRH